MQFLRSLTNYRPLRFLFAGGIGALVHISTVYILSHVFSVWYRYATIIGFFCALAIGFFLQKFFTFKDPRAHVIPVQSSIYILITSFNNLFLNGVFMYVCVEKIGLLPAVAQCITSLSIAPLSYIGYRKLFRTHSNNDSGEEDIKE